MNKIETFNKFNCGSKRPNRNRHLELNGFCLRREILHDRELIDSKPLAEVNHYIEKLSDETGAYYHAVYVPKTDAGGFTNYDVWVKTLD